MFNIDVLTLFAFFGTFQGLVFAVIFWIRNEILANKVFALLLLATSIRIAKNIFVHLHELNPDLFNDLILWRSTVYIALSHQFIIGPLFLLYFWSKTDSKFKLKRIHYWHVLPYTFFVGISPFVQWPFWANGGLWCSYVSILGYYLATIWYYNKEASDLDIESKKWLKTILVVTGILLISYSPSLFKYIGYIGGATLYTMGILFVGFVISGYSGTSPMKKRKYDSSSIQKNELQEIKTKLLDVMTLNRPYLNPELSLNELAVMIEVKPHHLSRVINELLNKSFADFINEYRLDAAIIMLKDSKNDHLKMAAIAYQSGFNSVPTFNTLFKKTQNSTPSAFRKNLRSN